MLSSPLLAVSLMSPPCQMTLPLQESETGFRSSLFTHTTNSLLFQLQFPQNLEWIAGAALWRQRPCPVLELSLARTPSPQSPSPTEECPGHRLSPPATSQGQTSLSGCPYINLNPGTCVPHMCCMGARNETRRQGDRCTKQPINQQSAVVMGKC